jgi:hypothetical protein
MHAIFPPESDCLTLDACQTLLSALTGVVATSIIYLQHMRRMPHMPMHASNTHISPKYSVEDALISC